MTLHKVYHHKDYLGTPRVTFTDVNNDGTITAAADILDQRTTYPYGWYAFGARNPAAASKEDFTGHELIGEEQAPLYAVHDMQARFYLPALGVFSGVDPLADQFPSYSPYNYTLNNPVNLVDPDGKAPIPPIGAMASGAAIGAGVDYVIQVGFNLFDSNKSWSESFTDVNKTSLAISAGAGALSGGVGGVLTKFTPVQKALTYLGIDATASATAQAAEDGTISPLEVAGDAVIGQGVGKVVGDAAQKFVRNGTAANRATTKGLENTNRRATNRAANREQIASQGGRARPAQGEAARNSQNALDARGAGAAASSGAAASNTAQGFIDDENPR